MAETCWSEISISHHPDTVWDLSPLPWICGLTLPIVYYQYYCIIWFLIIFCCSSFILQCLRQFKHVNPLFYNMENPFVNPTSATDCLKRLTFLLYLLILWSGNFSNAYFIKLNLMLFNIFRSFLYFPVLYWSFVITFIDFSEKGGVLFSSLLKVQNSGIPFVRLGGIHQTQVQQKSFEKPYKAFLITFVNLLCLLTLSNFSYHTW